MELKLSEHWECRGWVNSCLCSVVPLSYATRHFGQTGGGGCTGWKVTLLWSSIRNKTFFTGTPLRCIPACIITSLRDSAFGLWGSNAPTEFDMEDAFLYRDSASLHYASQGIGRRLGRDYACITLRSACSDIPACIVSSLRDFSFVLFHRTFWATPRDNK